jgi:hypothetical protein
VNDNSVKIKKQSHTLKAEYTIISILLSQLVSSALYAAVSSNIGISGKQLNLTGYIAQPIPREMNSD